MSPICAILRESFDDYLGDALPAPQRRMLREHLTACAGVPRGGRGEGRVLSLRARRCAEEVAPDETARILAGVRAGVGHIETERRIATGDAPPVRGRRRGGRGGAARPDDSGRIRRPPWAGDRGAPRAGSEPGRPEQAAVSSGIAPAGLPAEAAAPSSGATVYDLNPGARPRRAARRLDRGSRARYLTRISHARAGSERGRGLSFA